MDALKLRERPEAKLQKEIIKFLRNKEWLVMVTHGNAYQHGFPDLFATHARHSMRWIEVKLPGMKGSHFTPAQLEYFPQMTAHGAGVWIMTGASEMEYQVLFGKSNWHHYLPNMLK